MNRIGFAISSLIVLIFFGTTCLFVVDQRKFAVVSSFAAISDVIATPGLYFKWPSPLQTVSFMDKRILTLDIPETTNIQTAEKKNIVVDWFVKWRVEDPKKFIRANNGPNILNAENRIVPKVQSALNEEITRRSINQVLTTDRAILIRGLKARLDDDFKDLGIELVDLRIKRLDLPNTIAASVFSRMESERKQEANRLRATGLADGERIRADADKKKEIILATAYRQAQKNRGEGDAKASVIYREAFSSAPEFASFYRNLEAYKETFTNKGDVVVLDPSSDFFRAMRSSSPGGKK